MPEPIIVELSDTVPNIDTYLIGITHIHASCIEHDKTQATFLPPLSYSKMLQWWTGRFDEVIAGNQHIWVELQPISSRKDQLESPFKENAQTPVKVESDPDTEYEVAGLVALDKPVTETGAFRGYVHKLLVSPNHRQKGIARRLMAALEKIALREGRWNLSLDTEVGSPAEKVYPKLGYIPVGIIPQNGYSPVPGKLPDELVMYKNLRKGTL